MPKKFIYNKITLRLMQYIYIIAVFKMVDFAKMSGEKIFFQIISEHLLNNSGYNLDNFWTKTQKKKNKTKNTKHKTQNTICARKSSSLHPENVLRFFLFQYHKTNHFENGNKKIRDYL
jgi:hypothetical protein